MIGRQHLAIHLVSQHHAPVGIHCPVELDRSAIVSIWLSWSAGMSTRQLKHRRTSLSAPSMHTYLAPLFNPAFFRISPMATPVHRALETPAAPQEKPFVLRTTFCSFRLLPAQTRVTGHVIWSYSRTRSLNLIVSGFSTSLSPFRISISNLENVSSYPSTVNSQSGISSSLTCGTGPWFLT